MSLTGASERDVSTVTRLGATRLEFPGRTLSVRLQRSGRWTIIVVDGEMDLQTRPLVTDLCGSDAAHLIFKLSGVTFMDAAAVGLIVSLQRNAVLAGGCVRLLAPSKSVRWALALTETNRLFLAFDALDQALAMPIPSGPERTP